MALLFLAAFKLAALKLAGKKRNSISLLVAMLFVSMAITGVLGFFLPFNILTVSVHAFLGFLFILIIALHVKNNFKRLKDYFSSKTALIIFTSVVSLIVIIVYQPKPVKALLALSQNLGPAVDSFKLGNSAMTYNYNPAPHYKMQLDLKGGKVFDSSNPPYVAIWLENTSSFHIKSLYHSGSPNYESMLPYWHHKKSEYQKHKKQAAEKEISAAQALEAVDGITSATPNDSFDPADYIVPRDPQKETPYRLLIEINLPNDNNEYYPDQPSLVYSVEVDNKNPRSYQVLEIVGYPKTEIEKGKTVWSLFFVDEKITTAHEIFDSALLSIERTDVTNLSVNKSVSDLALTKNYRTTWVSSPMFTEYSPRDTSGLLSPVALQTK